MGLLTLAPTLPPRNMAIAAKVLLFIQDFCTIFCTTFCTTFCTGQTRNDGLVICCNPYP
jgi:IMP dehydrogenase